MNEHMEMREGGLLTFGAGPELPTGRRDSHPLLLAIKFI